MPAPRHYDVLFTGTLGVEASPAEVWSFGLSVDAPDTLTTADLDAIANDLVTAPTGGSPTAWSQIASSIQQTAILRRVRVVSIANDGKYERDASGAYIMGERKVLNYGASAEAPKPWQISLAVTLHTAVPGATGRGRFYLPMPTGSIGDDGLMTAAAADTHRTNAVALMDNILGSFRAITPSADIVVASAGSALRGIPARLNKVNGVSVGRRFDVQRRRAGSLSEKRGMIQAYAF